MDRNDHIFFSVLAIVLLAIVLSAAASHGDAIITGTWLAGLGGILTVGAAIIISRLDGQARRADADAARRRNAAAFAARFTPFVVGVQNFLERFDLMNRDGTYGLAAAMADMLNAIMRFEAPSLTDRQVFDHLSHLDTETTQAVVLLVAVVDDHNAYIKASMPSARALTGEERASYIDDMARRIDAMRRYTAYLRPRMDRLMAGQDAE